MFITSNRKENTHSSSSSSSSNDGYVDDVSGVFVNARLHYV
jgi:hypothetical protein